MGEKITTDLSKVKLLTDEEVKVQQKEPADQLKEFIIEFKKKIEPLRQMFKNFVKSIHSFFRSLAKWASRNIIYFYRSPQKMKQQKQNFKLDLIRPIIKHQVLDRKPHNLIRKVF